MGEFFGMIQMIMITVGVLKGGPSSEHEVSLKSAQNIEKALLRSGYKVRPVFIDKEGVWHAQNGSLNPERILSHVDVVFNALHGTYGEDGQVQKILEAHHIPFTGSGSLASALAMNKHAAKNIFARHNIPMPKHAVAEQVAEAKFWEDHLPVVVKPINGGSSVGTHVVREAKDLKPAIKDALQFSPRVMIEEYIPGTEITCGVLEGWGGKKIVALPLTEIVPRANTFFDYDAKYSQGGSQEITPARLPDLLARRAQDMALTAHEALGLRHYSRSDMIVNDGKVYLLEINTLPGFTATSLFPQGARSAGIPIDELIRHLIQLARS